MKCHQSQRNLFTTVSQETFEFVRSYSLLCPFLSLSFYPVLNPCLYPDVYIHLKIQGLRQDKHIYTHIHIHTYWTHFLFYIGAWSSNNVVIVPGEQQRDSAILIHVSILPQTPVPSRLRHNVDQSSLCYTAGPCWLSTLNIALCWCPSQTL